MHVTINIAMIYILRNDTAERIPADKAKAHEHISTKASSATRHLSNFLKTYKVKTAKNIFITPANQTLYLPGKKEHIV
jgi:hypothetical protein